MPYALQRLIAIGALVGLSPLLVCVALAIRVTSGKPIMYAGERMGKGATPFEQLKFRTMVNDADALLKQGSSPESIDRITPIGRHLRRWSVDELPQLINVARGEMAIIGPRPLHELVSARVPADHPRYSVLPGLTGYAQITGRNDVPWSDRLELDSIYVDRRSLRFDLMIILRSVRVVLTGQGIANDRNTSEVFDL